MSDHSPEMATASSSQLGALASNSNSLWVSLFFDGTGNCIEIDEPLHRLSNIAKLFKAHLNVRTAGIYRFYYRGVGTRAEESGPLAWLRDSTALGGGTGLGGQSRIRHALFDLAQAFAENPQRRLRQISIFGFSRGAAIARHLANLLQQQGIANQQNPSQPYRVGQDFQISFMGLFDTVASFGVAGNNIDMGYQLDIPDAVDCVVHCVAAHERRSTFDLHSIRDGIASPLAENRSELLFPGMHADVGGGYGPDDQGRLHNLAQIPLEHMLSVASDYGVPFRSRLQLDSDPQLQGLIEAPDELLDLYQDYCQRQHPEPDLQRQLAHHECLYFRWLHSLLQEPARMEALLQAQERRRQQLTEAAQRADVEVQQLRLEMLQKVRLEQRQVPYPLQGIALQAEVQRRLHSSQDILSVLADRAASWEALDICSKSIQRQRKAYQDLREQYDSARWRRSYLKGDIPDFEAPLSAFIVRKEDQLMASDVVYRQRVEDALVVKPLQAFERDQLTWCDISEPLPESMQRLFSEYVHDSVAHTPDPTGDHYFQRRSIFFRKDPPWRT